MASKSKRQKEREKREIHIGSEGGRMGTGFATFAEGLRYFENDENGKMRKKTFSSKDQIDDFVREAFSVSQPARKTYFANLRGILDQHMTLQNARSYEVESEIVGQDFGHLINTFGGKYAGLVLFHAALKRINVDKSQFARLPFHGVESNVYANIEQRAKQMGLVAATKDYVRLLSEHSTEFAKGFQDMLDYVRSSFQSTISLPYRFNIRTSCNFEFGGPPGFLESVMAEEKRTRKPEDKAKLMLNFFLTFYNHKFYEGIIPDGVSCSPLVQKALYPDQSAFVFTSLSNATNPGVIIESVLGHASGIAKGGHSVYTRVNNGTVEEIVNSFSRLPFVFRVNGQDNHEYYPLIAVLQGKDYQEEWEKHHQERLQVWKAATHEINGMQSPMSQADLALLEKLGRGLEELIGYPLKLEISKKGGVFYPLQLDPLSVSVDKSYDTRIPEGAIVFTNTPFVNKPFRAQGRMAYGPYDALGKLDEEMVFLVRWEDAEGVQRLDPDMMMHYCNNIQGLFCARSGARTCHSAGGIYDLKGFMGTGEGYGPLAYMFETDKETRITSTPFKVVLVSDGERGVGYIPKEEMPAYQIAVKKHENWVALQKK